MSRYWILLALAIGGPAEEWTRFRGPNGTGISADKGFPIEFGTNKNLVWRTPVRAGKSSPILTKDRIFLTGFEKETLYTQCFDRATGKLLWERSVQRVHHEDTQRLNHPAAVTPVTDGENVYVFFKDYGLLAYDGTTGELRWRVPMGPFSNMMGLAASPILAGESLILQVDQLDDAYIAAYSTRDGQLRWKSPRTESEGWATPLLYQAAGEPPQIITVADGQMGAHRVSDGKRTLSYPGISKAMVASPILDGDTIYTFGYGSAAIGPFSQVLAAKDKNGDGKLTPDEYGDDAVLSGIGKYAGRRDGVVNQENWAFWQSHAKGATGLFALHLDRDATAAMQTRQLWQFETGFTSVIPSPLFFEGVVYVVKNGGILTAWDAKTGERGKMGRLSGALGGYSASPVLAEGRLYLASEEGKISVVRASREWEVIQVNDIGEGFFATPALSGGRIFARSDEALYCFGASAPQ